MSSRALRHIATFALVAAAYLVSAKLGLRAALVAQQVTVVWPPTGIALAAVLVLGRKVWPAIALGAFLANITADETVPVALGISAGNTLEALLGAALLERIGFRWSMARLKDVFGVAFVAATVSTTASATIGVTSLCLGGVQEWSRFGSLWWMWWLGDAAGDLLIAPALLTWAGTDRRLRPPGGRLEAAVVALLVLVVALVAFAGLVPRLTTTHPLEYTIFPIVIWAAIRFGPRGASLVAVAVSTISVLGTFRGFGPFAAAHSTHESLVLLQLFMSTVAGTGLVLAAATMERRSAERYRATALDVSQVLDAAESVSDAMPRVLAAIGGNLGWDLGRYCSVDPEGRLRCEHVWRVSGRVVPDRALEAPPAGPGRSLIERVQAAGEGLWIRDQAAEGGKGTDDARAKECWRGAVAFPVRCRRELVGVFEFVSRRACPRDPDAVPFLTGLAGQIGLFLERREIEDSLRQNHAALRAVVEGTTDSVFIKDRDGRYKMINDAGARFVGKSVPEILGKDDTELFAAESAHRLMQWDRQIMDAGTTVTSEHTLTAAGVTRTFLSTKGPYRDPDGQVIGLIGISRDITERKAAEEERARLYREAKEASRMKDQFLAMLAHELRNPLAPVRNALEIVRREGHDPARLEWVRQVMTRQVDQIGRLVDDLLEIARLTSGRIELARRKVDLGDLLWELVEANRHLATERSLTVDLLVPDDSIVVSGDPVRLSQVFVNLFRNAVKYTNPHGWIDIRLRREERLAVVVMRDSGIGIDPAMLPSLFEPFTQADRSLARSEGGLGLGLTLVRRLVEMHGGVVEVSSPGPGQGSTFTVRLPLGSDRAVVAEERPAASAPDVHASRRILVVEDSADSAETLAIMLRLAGHQVQIAPDGPSALEAFERYEPSVVILDIGLPGMDGYEVARRLRASHDGRRISLIALTGYGQAEDRRRSAEAGFDHHLVKPVDPVILEELLDSSGNPSES